MVIFHSYVNLPEGNSDGHGSLEQARLEHASAVSLWTPACERRPQVYNGLQSYNILQYTFGLLMSWPITFLRCACKNFLGTQNRPTSKVMTVIWSSSRVHVHAWLPSKGVQGPLIALFSKYCVDTGCCCRSAWAKSETKAIWQIPSGEQTS